MHLRLRSALATMAALVACGACSNVPVGFGSGESLAHREVVAPLDAIWSATLVVLQERGDSVEAERRADGGGVMRTGRFQVVIEPIGDGATRIDIYNADYVGLKSQREAEGTLDSILERLR